VIDEDVAVFLGDLLLARYPGLLQARYKFDTAEMDGVDVVEGVAKRRGYRLKGGELDIEKAAMALLVDYRSGALGRISLETPESRALMLEAAAAKAAEHSADPADAEDD